MRKKTHEDYVKELKVKNPTVNVIGRYVDANTKIPHYCLNHNVLWDTTPSRALKGVGCRECRKEKFRNARLKTHEQYVAEVDQINPDIEVVDKYVDAATAINHRCKKHNVLWKCLPDNILHGHGCYECGKEKIGDKNRKTYEQYIKEVSIVNPNIDVLEEYIDTDTPILHKCKIDEHIWLARPSNILHGKGCPRCAGNLQLTNEEYIARLKEANPNILPLAEYVSANTPILHQCLIDGYIWETTPYCALQGGCPKCAGNIKKTHSEYVLELSIKNPYIEAIGRYINSKTPILHRCKIDGYEWKIAPSNVLCGQGCPQCQESNGERQIRYWLEKHNCLYIYQKTFAECKHKKALPFDFYLPDLNVLIEYDGQQHFKPIDFAGKGEEWAVEQLKITQHRDEIKNQYCANNNIKLLRIPYFKNIEEELEKFLFILI